MGIIKDFSRLKIEHVIIHEVKKQKKSDKKQSPVYSEIESILTPQTEVFIRNKFVDTIGSSKSYDVLFDPTSISTVPSIVKNLLNTKYSAVEFLKASKIIADQLNKEQTGKNPGGFVLLLYGINNNTKVVGILKLEKEEGAQLKQSKIGGKKTFEISNLKNLILSKHTKLFKVSVFYKPTKNSYEGKICDNQLTGKGDIATFFLEDFLGCTLKADPSVETKNFYHTTIDFIKERVEDPYNQVQYKVHLQSYLSSQSSSINPRYFSVNYLDVKYRSEYEKFLKERNIPIQNILKNTAYVDKFIKKSLYVFENGIQIAGGPETLEKNAKFEKLENGKTRATIESRLRNI